MNKKDTKKIIEIKWKLIIPIRSLSTTPNAIKLVFEKTNKPNRKRVSFIIGEEIQKKIGWEIGANVDIFYNEDNLKEWKICKTKTGRKLTKNGSTARVSFYWDLIEFYIGTRYITEYHFVKDVLEFTVPD